MMKKYFEGRIEHNSETIRRLYKAEYDTYEMKMVIIRYLAGALLAAGGLLGQFPIVIQAILMMIGCWLIVSRDFPSKCRADRALENRKQALPVIRSVFCDDCISLDGEGHMDMKYDCVQYLVDEKGYYFLFFGRNSACMIDGQTLQPDAADEFKQFASQKTGLEWRESTFWLNMNLQDIITMVKSRRGRQ